MATDCGTVATTLEAAWQGMAWHRQDKVCGGGVVVVVVVGCGVGCWLWWSVGVMQ